MTDDRRRCDPIERLVLEHEVIVTVLDAVDDRVALERRGVTFDPILYGKAFDFFEEFADRFHHAKEEAHLFPELERAGVPNRDGPIGCLLDDHAHGRARVRAARAALVRWARGDAAAAASVREEAVSFVDLLRLHIEKEEKVLFRMAERDLSPDSRAALIERFEAAERALGGAPARNRLLALAHDLASAAKDEPRARRLRDQQA